MLSDLRTRLRALFRRPVVNQELAEELRFHLEQQAEKYVRAGMSPEQAMRKARLEFGGIAQVEEQCRQARGVTQLEMLAQDLRFCLRVLRKSPGFTLVIVVTLALGIGANLAIFSLVNAVMLRSLPVRDPQQLVVAQWFARNEPQHLGTSSYGDCDTRNVIGGCTFSEPMFQQIRRHNDVFSSVMAFAGPSQIDVSGNGPAVLAQGEMVSGNYFETLGVTAALGRSFNADDEKDGAPPVAVLDFGYWQRTFGAAPDVIGRAVHFNGAAFTIVGVAEPAFTRLTPGKSVDLWVPFTQASRLGVQWARRADTHNWWLVVVARLQPGVPRSRAQAAINQLFVNESFHGDKPVWTAADDPRLLLVPAQQGLAGIRSQYGEPLKLLMAAVSLVLLIACANVAGLMLARGASREREMAVRLAMGATRRRVIRQLLTESFLLSFLGAALGAALAYAGTTGLAAFFSENSYRGLRLELHPNTLVLFFAMGIAVATAVGFGLAPAFRGARAQVMTELKGNASTTVRVSGTRHHFGLGNGLVIVQVALSMVVLTGAGLLLRTLGKLHDIDPGFDTRNVLLFSVDPQLAGYKDTQIAALYTDLQRRLAGLPGVLGVSYSSDALLDGSLWTEDVRIEGRADTTTVEPQMLAIGSDYFQTMKIPLMAGRFLLARDLDAAARAAVVNREFVRRFIGARNPLGLHFGGTEPKDPQWQIVGVVGDTKYATLRNPEAPTAYVPLTGGGATFEIRSAGSPSTLMAAVMNQVNQAAGDLPIFRMRSQSDSIDRLLFNERLVARLFGFFGALGLLLASVGLYGLLSYGVARRTREIGIRTALGAQRRKVLFMILRQGLVLVTVGVVTGVAAAAGVTRLLTSLLYQVRPTDPFTFALAAGLLILVGTIACLIPARRATHVDPMEALRNE